MTALQSRVETLGKASTAIARETNRVANTPADLLRLFSGLQRALTKAGGVGTFADFEPAEQEAALELSLSPGDVNSFITLLDTSGFVIGAADRNVHNAPRPLAGVTTVSPQEFERVASCFQALDQLEYLVLDKDFQLEKNNNSIVQRTKEKPFEEAFNSLPESLRSRFTAAFAPFTQTDLNKQRAQRVSHIMQLRADIIRESTTKSFQD